MAFFSELLQWLALATGDDAKNEGPPRLEFVMPATPPDIMQLTERRPAERFCCSMGQILPGIRVSLSLDAATLWSNKHKYRIREETGLAERATDGGGTIGFFYTRHGGFIDLGHARDFIDYTRYFTLAYQDVAKNPQHRGSRLLFNDDVADVYLVAQQLSPKPDLAISALIGAKLAFEFSVWHEVMSYFTEEKFSSFAPEDLFSNAVGVLSGFKALFKPVGEFDVAADQALKEILELLQPVSMETTDAATQYVKGRWWDRSFGKPRTERRNFMPPGAITPWLVTDVPNRPDAAVPPDSIKSLGSPRPAEITFATHYNGIFLEQRGHLVFKKPATNSATFDKIIALLPGRTEIRSIDLLAVSEGIRALARADEGAHIDQP